MQVTKEPFLTSRPAIPTVGIRLRTPMRGMHPLADKLRKELDRWMALRGFSSRGQGFLRLHVIDMEGTMDIEVGVPLAEALEGDDRVRPGELPAGTYAAIAFVGHGLTGNKRLLQTMADRGWVADRWDDPQGDAFACRCETVLTDRRLVSKKTLWEIEVSIKVLEAPPT